MNNNKREKYIFLVIFLTFFYLGFKSLEVSSDLGTDREKLVTPNEASLKKLKKINVSKSTENFSDKDLLNQPFKAEKQILDYFELESKNAQYIDTIQNEVAKHIRYVDSKDEQSIQNQKKINSEVSFLINNKKEWFKKEVEIGDSERLKVLIFSKFEKRSKEFISKKRTAFEDIHDVVFYLFYKVGSRWETDYHPQNISSYYSYNNENVAECRFETDSLFASESSLVIMYLGIPSKSNAVAGLVFEDKKFIWKDFKNSGWIQSTETEFKAFDQYVEEQRNLEEK